MRPEDHETDLLRKAVDERVSAILNKAPTVDLESESQKIRSRSLWSRVTYGAMNSPPAMWLSERFAAPEWTQRRSDDWLRAWALAKAVGVLALPGAVFYVILSTQLDWTQIVITLRVALSLSTLTVGG